MVDMFEDNDENDPLWLPLKLAAKYKKRQKNKKGMYSPFVSAETMLSSSMQSVRLAKTDAKEPFSYKAPSVKIPGQLNTRYR